MANVLGVLLGTLFMLATVLAITAGFAWVGMLLLGVAHSIDPAVPALGFVPTLLLTIIARAVTIHHHGDSK